MSAPPSHPALLAVLLLALGCVGLGGCAPAHPLDAKIAATSGDDLAAWRAKIEPRLSPEEKTELDAALQEFRLSILTFTREASDPATVEALLRTRIDRLPLRQLYIEGARLRILRITPEHDTLRAALEANQARLHAVNATPTAEADTDTEALRARVARQTERLRKLSTDLEAAKARLFALGDAPP